jgi:hypothetical protein
MRRHGIHAASLVIGAVLLSSCATTSPGALPASTESLVHASAVACVRVASGSPNSDDRQLCDLYVDLRLWRIWGGYVDQVLSPRLRVTPLPCLADGPGCLWHETYEGLFRTETERVFGNPDPQPSSPLPFDMIPAEVQLEKAVALRSGLLQAVVGLDSQIETLRAATQGSGEAP